MILVLKPNDVLLFRESKPFGIDYHLARTTFPLPQTVAGALRSAIYLKDKSKAEEIGLGKEEPKFEIVGTFFYKKSENSGGIELLSECPKDVASDFSLVKPRSLQQLGVEIFQGSDIHLRPLDAFFRVSTIARYLQGEVKREYFIERSRVFVRERRVGIALEDGKVTRERHFYTTELLRLSDDCGLAVWVEKNLDELNGEIVRLGGEGRFAKLERVPDPKFLADLQSYWKGIRKRINRARRLRLYLATPAIFKSGAYRPKPDTSELVEKLRGNVKIERIYWLTGKPLVFSGWDYVAKKPKATRYAVPAGSVYFVEFEGEVNLDKPYVKLGELTKLGYGLCFLGVW